MASTLEAPASDTTVASPELNPFDPEQLKLSQDFASTVGVKKVLTAIPCRKPNRHEFVRVRPGAEWRLETVVFEDKLNQTVYLVKNAMGSELGEEVTPVCLFPTVNRAGDVSIWPVKLPGYDGKTNSWNESAAAAAKLAESKWTRVASNMPAGRYDTFVATGTLSDPEWPELSMTEILKLCFQDRFIEDADHPVVRSLRGAI
jgi:hypothetical protein